MAVIIVIGKEKNSICVCMCIHKDSHEIRKCDYWFILSEIGKTGHRLERKWVFSVFFHICNFLEPWKTFMFKNNMKK
jgi:hypothetical protein